MGKSSLKILTFFGFIFLVSSISNAQVSLDSLSRCLGTYGLQTAEVNSDNGAFSTAFIDITPLELRILGNVRVKPGEKYTGGRFRIHGSARDTFRLEIKGHEQNFRHTGGPFLDLEPRAIIADYFKGIKIPDIPSRQYFNTDFKTVWNTLSHVFRDMRYL